MSAGNNRFPAAPVRPTQALALLAALAIGLGAAAREDTAPPSIAGAISPYVARHAGAPIRWRAWGPAAFAEAKAQGKAVFVVDGDAACHWCDALDRETLADPEVAGILNERFIPVIVDRSELPDVDDGLVTSLLALTGQASWPVCAFLTPEGKPFDVSPYQPRAEFLAGLKSVEKGWADPATRRDMQRQGDRVATAVEQAGQPPLPGQCTAKTVSDGVKAIRDSIDAKNGGFGTMPKFPSPLRLELLLAEQARRPDRKILQGVTLTLDRMARSPLFDQVGGGFHRYCSDAEWRHPQWEKLLPDQALMAIVYLRASRLTKNPEYARIARETLDFALRDLRTPPTKDEAGKPLTAGFWSSLSSSAPGGEPGEFYAWTPAQIADALGEADGKRFCALFALDNEGSDVPELLTKSLEESAMADATPIDDLRAKLVGWRAKLRVSRDRRPRPVADDKVLASWNGLMIRALSIGYSVLGDEKYRKAAEETARFVQSRLRPPGIRPNGKLVHAWRADQAGTRAYLEDYSFMAAGLLELHRAIQASSQPASQSENWLDQAKALAETMNTQFWDEASSTWYATPKGAEPYLVRSRRSEDPDVPSGQSVAAEVLSQLARLPLADAAVGARAKRVLDRYASPMQEGPTEMAGMLLAAHGFLLADSPPPN